MSEGRMVCSICGSPDIEAKMWVKLSTDEIMGDAMEDDDQYWCCECEDHVAVVWEEGDDVPLDGDATSALSSAGMGTDEDYGG